MTLVLRSQFKKCKQSCCQSCLSNEDKKRILSMTDGVLSVTKIEKAMRTLSTKMLFGMGDVRKKVCPANYVESSDFQGLPWRIMPLHIVPIRYRMKKTMC